MSNRQQEEWGGEVRMPRWLRRMLRRPAPLDDTPEGAHEARTSQSGQAVRQGAGRGEADLMSNLYHEGRDERRAKRR